ncbi:MAG: cryptochrome/photolyase family protein [Anaerolineae bacterium]
MRTTAWILGDQLTYQHPALAELSTGDVVLMVESAGRAEARPWHKQKLAFIWSAMRHFAQKLRDKGVGVDYHKLPSSPVDLRDTLRAHLRKYQPDRLLLMETAEFGRAAALASLARDIGVKTTVLDNTMFLSSREAFAREAKGKTSLVMEHFYRDMRRKTGLLMAQGEPEGGRWNFDAENRESPPDSHEFPEIPRFEPDEATRDVMALVEDRFPDHFGKLETFAWPVTHRDARRFLRDFLDHRLDCFGPHEDAMVRDARALCHSLLSPLLNVGLLEPLDVCQQAASRYWDGLARLNSVEGFIRQILGWREFIYQIYHLKMPGYSDANFFEVDLPLPSFYWDGETEMTCVARAVGTVRGYGINHHIQRLMITGNFALIAGINPQAVNDWYLTAYVDAYEWVVTPNVLGLALYADGGMVATKPYAASANYINRMSDYCRSCRYRHRETTGETACPFNALYWDFLARNEERLRASTPRMNLMLAMLGRRSSDEIAEIRARAGRIRDRLDQSASL